MAMAIAHDGRNTACVFQAWQGKKNVLGRRGTASGVDKSGQCRILLFAW
jgi:hypothetical protein